MFLIKLVYFYLFSSGKFVCLLKDLQTISKTASTPKLTRLSICDHLLVCFQHDSLKDQDIKALMHLLSSCQLSESLGKITGVKVVVVSIQM